MTEAQFTGIFFMLLFIMLILEIGMLSICDHLRAIRKLLEKRDKYNA